jgi:hypothetical protein
VFATTAYQFRSTDLPSTQASQPRSQTRPARSRSDAPDESSTVRAREVASGGVGGGEVVRTSYGSGSGRHAVAIVSVDAAVAFDVAFDVAVYGEMGGCESWGDADGYTRPSQFYYASADVNTPELSLIIRRPPISHPSRATIKQPIATTTRPLPPSHSHPATAAQPLSPSHSHCTSFPPCCALIQAYPCASRGPITSPNSVIRAGIAGSNKRECKTALKFDGCMWEKNEIICSIVSVE